MPTDISGLHNAAFSADCETLARMVAKGCDPNARTRAGAHTPLHCAALGNYIDEYLEYYDRRIGIEDYIRAIEMLVTAGADPFLTDQEGRTPAAVAWQQAGDDERQRKFQELARFLDASVLACRH
jgi:hypothetical protein